VAVVAVFCDAETLGACGTVVAVTAVLADYALDVPNGPVAVTV
jgi:hypothetical protein